MTPNQSQDFISALMELEPFLSADAKKSLQAVRNIMACFPRQSLPEIEKSIGALLQGARMGAQAMADRATAIVQGRASESRDAFARDVKKLDATALADIGNGLGFTLSGTKTKMVADLLRWVETGGRAVPVSPQEQAARDARERAAPVKTQMQRITPDSKGTILEAAEAAHKALPADAFRLFAKELGVTVHGTKATMKKQFKDFVNGLAVTHVQTQF